jgi:hypothetical protein
MPKVRTKLKYSYAQTDCVHYKVVRMKVCCGRYEMGGVCTIPDRNGNVTHKTCSIKLKHCNYVAREEEDVQPS